jgi:hypothetical protein
MLKICTFANGDYQEVQILGSALGYYVLDENGDCVIDEYGYEDVVYLEEKDCFAKEWSIDFGWVGNDLPLDEVMITPSQFTHFVGRKPESDDLERVNCRKTGYGHANCGWNYEQNLPVFMVGRGE